MPILKTAAGWLANSFVLANGRAIYQSNQSDWNMQLSKLDKLCSGLYLIFDDYSKGLFPPKFSDKEAVYEAETLYRASLPGVEVSDTAVQEMRKPFWIGNSTVVKPVTKYLGDFLRLVTTIQRLNILPPARLLELGCGTGWMAEFLATAGFDVTGTSIAPTDIADARKRAASLAAKGLPQSLRFELAAMESAQELATTGTGYDAVYVFEALHHAFDWRLAIESSFECLAPGGYLLICNEPNLVHYASSYRVARLSNTHEIGLSRRKLISHLRHTGFTKVRNVGHRFHFWFRLHWIVAQKPAA